MAGKPKLQPLPKKLSEDPGREGSAGKNEKTAVSISDPAKKKKESSSSSKTPITPRRIALKFSSQTIVIEYKEQETGKLRHRSFRIDKARFESAEECEKKLWRRLSKAVVPGSLKEEQLHRLVEKLFSSGKSKDSTGEFDDDDLDAATDRLLAQQVELPAPTLPSNKPKEEVASPAAAKSDDDDDDDDEKEDKAPSSSSGLGTLGSLAGLPSLKGKGSGGLLKPMQPMSGGGMPAAMGVRDASDDDDEDGWTPPGKSLKKDAMKEVGRGAKVLEPEKKEEKAAAAEEEEIEYASDFEDIDIEESPRPAAHDGPGGEVKEGAQQKGDGDDAKDEDEDGIPEEKRKEIMAKIKEGEIDLQKVPAGARETNLMELLSGQDELAMYKRLMDVEFQKNALRPGDEGYKHDVQVEFEEPEEDAGWDEDDDYVPSDDDF